MSNGIYTIDTIIQDIIRLIENNKVKVTIVPGCARSGPKTFYYPIVGCMGEQGMIGRDPVTGQTIDTRPKKVKVPYFTPTCVGLRLELTEDDMATYMQFLSDCQYILGADSVGLMKSRKYGMVDVKDFKPRIKDKYMNMHKIRFDSTINILKENIAVLQELEQDVTKICLPEYQMPNSWFDVTQKAKFSDSYFEIGCDQDSLIYQELNKRGWIDANVPDWYKEQYFTPE